MQCNPQEAPAHRYPYHSSKNNPIDVQTEQHDYHWQEQDQASQPQEWQEASGPLHGGRQSNPPTLRPEHSPANESPANSIPQYHSTWQPTTANKREHHHTVWWCIPGRCQMPARKSTLGGWSICHTSKTTTSPRANCHEEDLKKELNRLQTAGVIAPINTPTHWVSNLVVIRKPSGKLRVSIDPKPLNKALKRNHCPLPVIEDILPDFASAKVFSLFDVHDGCWQLRLDDASSFLTTVEMSYGCYRWLRLPFGISPACEYFQQYLDQALECLPGIHTVADDILITGHGATKQEATRDHDHRVITLLEGCQKMTILKTEQGEVKVQANRDAIHRPPTHHKRPQARPAKIEAILWTTKPTNAAGVPRFVGMATCLSKFLPDLSDLAMPLHHLTMKDAEWLWTEMPITQHSTTSEKLLEKHQSYTTSTPVTPQHSSATHLTPALEQLWCSRATACVPFASTALTPTERNYAQ